MQHLKSEPSMLYILIYTGYEDITKYIKNLFLCVWKYFSGLPVAPTVKNLPAVQETRVQYLCREDPLEKGMAFHSSVLAWRVLWTEKPGGLQSMGSPRVRVRHDWATNTHIFLELNPRLIYKRLGNHIQCLLLFLDLDMFFPICNMFLVFFPLMKSASLRWTQRIQNYCSYYFCILSRNFKEPYGLGKAF